MRRSGRLNSRKACSCSLPEQCVGAPISGCSSTRAIRRPIAATVPAAIPPAGPAPTTITSKSVRVATPLTVLERGGALLYTTLWQDGALRLADHENGRRPRASRVAGSRLGTGGHGKTEGKRGLI